MSDNTFLPSEYDVPQKAGNYMRFTEGINRFRCLTSPILGWETWQTLVDGTRKPVRKAMDQPFNVSEVEDGNPEKIKHFWAMVVYNYEEEKIQILQLTQKGIQKSLRALAKDEDWGSPLGYDIVITREGKELETRYQVNPKPAKELDKKIQDIFDHTVIDLTALYRSEDPFSTEVKA